MLPCANCGDPLRGVPEKVGARCPTCREPLYEPARDPHVQASDGSCCAVHPSNGSVGTCQRCGNFVCGVCWTRWHDRSLCSACASRALDDGEAPHTSRAHFWQAMLAVIFGVLAWLLTLGAILLMVLGFAMTNQSEEMVLLVGVGGLVLLASPFPAVLGVGVAAAAIRARGNHMIMSTIGLVLSGLHAGMIVGLFTFSVLDR
jgi:hypothetical protein